MAEKKIEKYAVIRTGGKQYLVHEGLRFEIEKLDAEEGAKIKFDDVLLTIDGDKVFVGQPVVSGANVQATLVAQTKDEKKIVFKYKAKKNYRVKTGHRQKLSQVVIDKIDVK